jgi:hypothetical protein
MKYFAMDITECLTQEFNRMVQGEMEDWWKKGIIVLLPKKGDLSKIDNWRPITLLNIEWKLYTSIWKNRMETN